MSKLYGRSRASCGVSCRGSRKLAIMKAMLLCLAAVLAMPLAAAEKVYTDSRGKSVRFPLGDLSFADEVVSFEEGKPAAQFATARDPEQILGPPNFDEKRDRNYV